MAGIVSYGGYVPAWRMDRKVIADAWGRRAIKGERSLANNDEDSITMAVEAGTNCVNQRDRDRVDGLFFATTTAPYQEKMSATLISTAMDLKREMITTDFSNSLRSGTAALRAALSSVRSGDTCHHLVTAADQRPAYPKSDQEQIFGDGAGALLIGKDDLVARFIGDFSIANEMMDVWRKPEDRHVKMWEGRFIIGEGFTANIKEVVSGLLKKQDLHPKDVSKILIPGPDTRTCERVAASLGFDADKQLLDPLLSGVGHCGSAHPFLMLCKALEDARPGDLLLMTAYGDGADAFLFEATDKITEKVCQTRMEEMFAKTLKLSSYGRFLSYKNLVEPLPGEPFRLLPSASASFRERNSSLRCHGSRCRKCGQSTYPVQRICYHCRSKDDYDEIRISDKKGRIFTFTRDNIAGRSDDPVVVQTVAELEGEVRFYGLMTDCDPSKVDLDQPVRLTFRRIYEGAGFHNYFWKLKPA